jgi:hypothetical protein
MADLIPFPRTWGNRMPRAAQSTADMVSEWATYDHNRERARCANGMPGHPPCRSPAELEALLRARADVTAAREGV